MKNIKRILNLNDPLRAKSYFLLGPRQTGKSWLIRHELKSHRVYDLLDNETFLRLSRSPQLLKEEASEKDRVIIIDEIQKLPSLLDEVHYLIEQKKIKFLLTGSSARKLRRGGVNLLGGRARVKYLHPFVYPEVANEFNLLKALNYGLLPSIYFSQEPEEDLKAYAGLYLKTEIASEGLTRNLPAFSRFLEVAAMCNGTLLNFTKISNDAQVARTTVHEYFEILKDTLIAHELPAWKKSKNRKPVSSSKIYFFDAGITRILQNRNPFRPKSPEFGDAFETFCFQELRAYVDYISSGNLAHWKSTSNMEVDFILDDITAIEIKSSHITGPHDLKGLKAIQEEKQLKHHILVSLESSPRKVNGIDILPWQIFLDKLWSGKLSK